MRRECLVLWIPAAVSLRPVENLDKSQESQGPGGSYRWYVLMNVKVVVAILLIAALSLCAQAQSPSVPRVSKGDAQKVVTIISGDKAKTQTYCEIMKLGEQIGQAYEKNDKKMVAELSQKFETLEKALGPEYAALLDGLQYIDPQNHQLHAEFLSAFGALAQLCTR